MDGFEAKVNFVKIVFALYKKSVNSSYFQLNVAKCVLMRLITGSGSSENGHVLVERPNPKVKDQPLPTVEQPNFHLVIFC